MALAKCNTPKSWHMLKRRPSDTPFDMGHTWCVVKSEKHKPLKSGGGGGGEHYKCLLVFPGFMCMGEHSMRYLNCRGGGGGGVLTKT